MVLVAPAMLVKLAPPLVERCHCTVGVGTPDAAAVKVTEVPGFTVWFGRVGGDRRRLVDLDGQGLGARSALTPLVAVSVSG